MRRVGKCVGARRGRLSVNENGCKTMAHGFARAGRATSAVGRGFAHPERNVE